MYKSGLFDCCKSPTFYWSELATKDVSTHYSVVSAAVGEVEVTGRGQREPGVNTPAGHYPHHHHTSFNHSALWKTTHAKVRKFISLNKALDIRVRIDLASYGRK